jgi:hypothetical protein
MSASKPNVRRYRSTDGDNEGMIIQVNRQMRGVKIESHPSNPTMVGLVYDLPDFLKHHDLDNLELL